jgi:hypothetical protein
MTDVWGWGLGDRLRIPAHRELQFFQTRFANPFTTQPIEQPVEQRLKPCSEVSSDAGA